MRVLWIRNLSLHLADSAGSSFMGWSITKRVTVEIYEKS